MYAEAERQKKEAVDRQAKLDEIAEKQRQREQELEEKERLRREAILGRSSEGPLRPDSTGVVRPSDSGPAPTAETAADAAETAASAPAKYVPKFKLRLDNSGQASAPDSERWGNGRPDDRQPSDRPRGYGFGSGSSSRFPRSSRR